MTQGRTQELLREAAALLREAGQKVDLSTLSLDMTHTECECCKMRRYRHWGQARTYKRISDVPTRLNHLADNLTEEADKLDSYLVK